MDGQQRLTTLSLLLAVIHSMSLALSKHYSEIVPGPDRRDTAFPKKGRGATAQRRAGMSGLCHVEERRFLWRVASGKHKELGPALKSLKYIVWSHLQQVQNEMLLNGTLPNL